MAVTVTVTGTAGAGLTLTAQVFNNVSSYTINSVTNMLSMVLSDSRVFDVSVNAATVVTGTKSGNTWTLVIS